MPAKLKSSRHSKIVGDFAEHLILYWLSRHGYECARVDHTGIDIIARKPKSDATETSPIGTTTSDVMGISVKCRDRLDHRMKTSVNLPTDGFIKAQKACDDFQCEPWYAIVVDAGGVLRCFMLPMKLLLELAGGTPDGSNRYWNMSPSSLERYALENEILHFQMKTELCSLSDIHPVEVRSSIATTVPPFPSLEGE